MSDQGKNLIKKLLVVDPKIRLTASAALKDPWFTKFREIQQGSEEDKLDPDVLSRLKLYRGVSTLKKVALNILVKMIGENNADLKHLQETFARIDTEQTGIITSKQLKAALIEAKIPFDE